MGSMDLQTITGNRSGDQNGINLDSCKKYSETDIDTESPPHFTDTNVLGSMKFMHEFSSEDEDDDEDDDDEEDRAVEVSKKTKIERVVKPKHVRCENATLSVEFLFASCKKEEIVTDENYWEYLIDVNPRILKAHWCCEPFGLKIRWSPSISFTFKVALEFPEIDITKAPYVFKAEYLREKTKKHLSELFDFPDEREGEVLYIITRIYHQVCFYPFLTRTLDRTLMSQEALVWTAGELGVNGSDKEFWKKTPAIEIWRQTKEKFLDGYFRYPKMSGFMKCAKDLILCIHSKCPDHFLGRNVIPTDILKIIFGYVETGDYAKKVQKFVESREWKNRNNAIKRGLIAIDWRK